MSTPSTETNAEDILVRKSIHVAAKPERAFAVFTGEMSTWWPLVSHHIGKVDAVAAVVEPFVGGRWFERGADGSECDWGRVLVWEPGKRVTLAWELSAEWKHDVAIQSEVDVTFVADAGGCLVTLEHRKLSTYGAKAKEMQAILGSDGGWGGMLGAFQRAAS
jgi:uncharacterized protein YndB with AHSA1/START domain